MQINLDHDRGGVPLYVQLAGALQDVIRLERMMPGDLLPSENVLATENHLSRATVIKAFDLLVDRGQVVRRQGKGTFVSSLPMQRMLPEFTSFSEHVLGLGLTPGNVLLSFDSFGPGATSRPESPFSAEIEIMVIERLRFVDERPVGIHRTIVSSELADRIGLTEELASETNFSFYNTLRRQDVLLSAGEETLRAVNADEHDSALLKVDVGTALMEAIRESRDASENIVEAVRARYLGSEYRYHIQLAPAGMPSAQLNSEHALNGTQLATGLRHLS